MLYSFPQPFEDQGGVGFEDCDRFGREPALVLFLQGLGEVPEGEREEDFFPGFSPSRSEREEKNKAALSL